MRSTATIFTACLMFASCNSKAVAQEEIRITFHAYVVPKTTDPFDAKMQANQQPLKLRRGQVARLIIEGRLRAGYHTYPLTIRAALQNEASTWKYRPAKAVGLAPLWPVEETPAPEKVEMVEDSGPIIGFQQNKPFTWSQDVLVLPDAKPGKLDLTIQLRGTVCTDVKDVLKEQSNCLPISTKVTAVFDVSDEEALPLDPALSARLNEEKPPIKVVTTSGDVLPPPRQPDTSTKDTLADTTTRSKTESVFGLISRSSEDYRKSMEAWKITGTPGGGDGTAPTDLWAFMLSGIFWGAISLVTPCVFPMIPITVSIFLKQSEKEHHRPVIMALVYSGTIVVVLTLAAGFLLSVLQKVSVNPWMNYGLGALFIFFALSLFGMYDIELPSGLARYTSAHESQGGYLGIVFMALTFTIISFACVAPFLGGFGGTSAGTARPMLHNLLGGLAFSVTFAAPFFFLALFPTLLRKMPKSGSWLNSVKVVMGFLELAAAVKFCRSAELVLTGSAPWLLTFDLGLGIYIVLFFLCGVYLLGMFRLPHDTPEEHLTVPRMMFAGMFLALGVYLVPALFKDAHGDNLRPQGTVYAWVESFLLPDSVKEGPHTPDLATAVAEARRNTPRTGRPQRIFIDFTGVVCQNCRLNEQHVFSKSIIQDLLKPYVIAKLYTDIVPSKYYSRDGSAAIGNGTEREETDADTNRAFQKKITNSVQLPQYVVIEAQADDTIQIVGVYDEGRINNEAAFADFLRNPK